MKSFVCKSPQSSLITAIEEELRQLVLGEFSLLILESYECTNWKGHWNKKRSLSFSRGWMITQSFPIIFFSRIMLSLKSLDDPCSIVSAALLCIEFLAHRQPSVLGYIKVSWDFPPPHSTWFLWRWLQQLNWNFNRSSLVASDGRLEN